jgi:hypothetical protein
MKIQKHNLGLRIITFLPRLVFILLWMILYGVLLNIRWLRFGSQELYFGSDFGRDELVTLIEKLEKLKELKSSRYGNRN